MSRLLDDDQDELPQRERELTLSTGAILAIFLGLVLLCGAFFGFGYNLGRKSTVASSAPLPTATNDEPVGTANSSFDNFKPSPNSPSAGAERPKNTSPASTTTAPVAVKNTEAEAPSAHPSPSPAPATHPAASPAPTESAPATPTKPAAPAITPGGAFVVQVAAISSTHKDDADLLSNALRGRGYTVSERNDPQDKLIHIQVGPFATKADAEAMRERLVVDGYNPIIK